MTRRRTRAKGGADSKFEESKHRREGGRFADKPGAGNDAPKAPRRLAGDERLKTSGVTANDEVVLISNRLRAYKTGGTVKDFVDSHPKGRAYALRKLAADHKKGVIGFKGAESPQPSPKPAVVPKEEVKPPPRPEPEKHAELRARIEKTYLALTGGQTGQAVRLSALRAKLPDLDRRTLDGALLRVLGGDKEGGNTARLSQFSSPKSLDAAERAAAFSPAGEPFHIFRLNRKTGSAG